MSQFLAPILRLWGDCPRFVIAATILVVSLGVIAFSSSGFIDQTVFAIDPVSWIVAAGILAGIGYMLIPAALPYLETQTNSLYWILATGLILRLMMMSSPATLEIDFYRYLWDGAVINAGFSPYEWSPRQIISGAGPLALEQLAQSAAGIIEQINYPHLTTIYPPVAEFIFAIINGIKPWDLLTLRLVILLFEIATVVLLFLVMKKLHRSPVWIVLYWWNPVVIFEFSNAAHMDALLLPFLVGALLLALTARTPLLSAICLALATAIKLWPVLLLPTFIRSITRVRVLVIVCVGFSIVTMVLLWPLLSQDFDRNAGLYAFSHSWERNAALFHTLQDGLRAILDDSGLFNIDSGQLLRLGMGITIIMIALGLNLRAPASPEALIRRIIIVIAALLLLGPTMFPWYYTWMVPFLALVPIRALLALSVVLPLYHLQFHPWFLAHNNLFTDIILWIEQGPVFLLLFIEWRKQKRSTASSLVKSA